MRQKGMYFVVGGFALLSAIGIIFTTTAQPTKPIQGVKSSSQSQVQQHTYLVKEYEGKVAVFYDNVSDPETIYDTYVNELPQLDQQQLRDGIVVNTQEELRVLIEDLTS